jgi:CBS domain-containing protein
MSRDQEVTVELRELLSGEVETISAEATVFEGAAAMQRAGVGSLAVVDDDEFTGIFTERDVLRAVASGLITVDAEVADWMTPYPDSFLPDMTVEEAADWMLAVGYRHLPVVERGELIGMASIKDILWAVTSKP